MKRKADVHDIYNEDENAIYERCDECNRRKPDVKPVAGSSDWLCDACRGIVGKQVAAEIMESLVKVATVFDEDGLFEQADVLDRIMEKVAEKVAEEDEDDEEDDKPKEYETEKGVLEDSDL